MEEVGRSLKWTDSGGLGSPICSLVSTISLLVLVTRFFSRDCISDIRLPCIPPPEELSDGCSGNGRSDAAFSFTDVIPVSKSFVEFLEVGGVGAFCGGF